MTVRLISAWPFLCDRATTSRFHRGRTHWDIAAFPGGPAPGSDADVSVITWRGRRTGDQPCRARRSGLSPGARRREPPVPSSNGGPPASIPRRDAQICEELAGQPRTLTICVVNVTPAGLVASQCNREVPAVFRREFNGHVEDEFRSHRPELEVRRRQ